VEWAPLIASYLALQEHRLNFGRKPRVFQAQRRREDAMPNSRPKAESDPPAPENLSVLSQIESRSQPGLQVVGARELGFLPML
jgi:hypothetical protein